VVFFKLPQVIRQAINAVSEQCNLNFSVTSVIGAVTVSAYDLSDLFFAVINCHFVIELKK
jgi:hypothetical protein